jgi:hypothetical protein
MVVLGMEINVHSLLDALHMSKQQIKIVKRYLINVLQMELIV